MKNKNSRALKLIVSILLMVSVLCCSFSVFAAEDDPNRIQMEEGMIGYYVWYFLHSIGIDVTLNDVWEYEDYVVDTIIDWIINYIADMIEADNLPSNYSIAQWVAPWQVGYDYWGNLQYNSTMLEDLQDFAEWLKGELSLLDDSEVVINPVYAFSGYNLYEFNHWYAASRLNGEVLYVNMEVNQNNWSSPNRVYWMPVLLQESGYIEILAISDANFYVGTTEILGMYNNGDTQQIAVTASMGNAGQGFYGYSTAPYWIYGMWNPQNYKPLDSNYFTGTRAELANFIRNGAISMEGDVIVLTNQIVLPEDNPYYTAGDGVTIIDGQPVYQQITFSGEVTNLPAIVSTQTIENPHMEEAYRPVRGLLEMTKDGVELMHGIVNELPAEAVTCVYALIGAVIVFGMIKLMREH